MFGIELPNLLFQQCLDNGGVGYIINSSGKPTFSNGLVPNAIGIAKFVESIDAGIDAETRNLMNEKQLSLVLFSRERDKSRSFLPDRYFENSQYENRIYVYGIFDCYTLIRDYFRDKYDVWLPANIDRSFGWWHNGRNLYVDMYERYGFKETTDKIKKDDVLIFKFDNGMPSHSAIYIGDGMMLHHMIGRFSCIERFDGIYKMSLAGVLRYNGSVE